MVITFANPIFFNRLNVFSPILPTAAPSVNVLTVSSFVGFPLIVPHEGMQLRRVQLKCKCIYFKITWLPQLIAHHQLAE